VLFPVSGLAVGVVALLDHAAVIPDVVQVIASGNAIPLVGDVALLDHAAVIPDIVQVIASGNGVPLVGAVALVDHAAVVAFPGSGPVAVDIALSDHGVVSLLQIVVITSGI